MIFGKRKVYGTTDAVMAAASPEKWVHPLEGMSGDAISKLRPLEANFYWTAEINGAHVVFYKSVWIYAWMSEKAAERKVKSLNQKIEKAMRQGAELPPVPQRIGDWQITTVTAEGRMESNDLSWNRDMSRLDISQSEREFRSRQVEAGIEPLHYASDKAQQDFERCRAEAPRLSPVIIEAIRRGVREQSA